MESATLGAGVPIGDVKPNRNTSQHCETQKDNIVALIRISMSINTYKPNGVSNALGHWNVY